MTESVSGFMRSREDGICVRRVWNEAMRGWDIVVVLDGHYFDDAHAEEMRAWYSERLLSAMHREGMRPRDPGTTYRYEPVSKDTLNRSSGL